VARRGLVHLYAYPPAHRVVPARVAFRLIDAFAALSQRRRTAFYEDCVRYHRELLRYTALAADHEDVARRSVAEVWRNLEIFWRPWLSRRGEIEGMKHYRRARLSGRGIVAAFPHFGMPYAQFPIMRHHSIDAWVIAAPEHYRQDVPGYPGLFKQQGRRYVEELGPRRAVVRQEGAGAEGAFARALRLLREGATVSVAFDSVGTMPTPFLGRSVNLASGASQLAFQAGAVLLPFVHRRRGHRPLLRFSAPIDPRDFGDARAVQAALASVMEGWALELPEAVWPLNDQPGGPPLIHGQPLRSARHAAVAQRGPG
jgi:lauroyl/myristoyl acyltransferase